ncbi:MAG TPA: IS1634 family transposase [Thiotrichaceae bacterium]|nr:IS1634 family transposase [Thiotrichaceae bacterium]
MKQTSTNLKAFEKLCRQDFESVAEAETALSQFDKTLSMTFVAECEIVEISHYHSAGRPSKKRLPDKITFRISGSLASIPSARIVKLERKSCFILATNQLDMEALSDQDLIDAYKDQQKVERGFRFLKDPLFMASTLFLKSTKRVMALMMVMTLCLLVYAALEYRIRETLLTHDHTFPNQKGKAVQNPTVRWVFQFFSGIPILHNIKQSCMLVLNLNEYHIDLLKLLGKSYELLYSDSG